MALADTARLIASLELQDKFTGPANRVGLSLGRLESGMSRMGRGAGQVAAGLGRIGLIGATAAAGGFVAVAKVAGDFEAQLNTINTIVKLTDRDLKTLGEGIRSTFRETGEPLEDLTAAYYALLSAGIKVEDAQSVLNTSVKLGIGGLATTAEAVDLMTTAINAYALNASGAAAASDIFAAAVRDGKVTVADLNASFSDVAPIAATVGIKLEEIGAAYAALTARGVEATEVGTQFNRAILELLKPGPQLVKVMESLGLASFETSIRQKGLVATLQDARDEAERLGIPMQDLFGRIEGYKFALATTGPNQAKFNQELKAMGEAAGETNAQFAERQQGLNFQIAKLKALAQDAGITIGNALLPKLVPLVTRLNDFIQKNQGKIEEFGQRMATAFGNFADAAQKADFSGLISGLKLLGDVGKKVVDIFLSLPPGIQAAIVTGAAINKLSGGLLGAGAGNIVGGAGSLIFDRFLARGSGPHNPIWVQSGVGGVGGLPVAGGFSSLLLLGPFIAAGITGGLLGAAAAEAAPAPFGGTKLRSEEGAEAIRENTAALKDNTTNLGQFDPKNFGGTPFDKGIFGDSKGGKRPLPDTALSPGGTAVKLPDTAMSNLGTIATETKKLPPILTRQEIAAQTLNAKLAATVPKAEQARPDLSKNIISAIQNSSSASNAWSARQLAAFAQVTAAQRTTAGKTGEVAQRVNEARGAIGRGFGDLGSAQRQVAARVAEARNAINATTGAVREGTGVLRSLAGKKGDVIVKLTSNVSVSISDIQRKITSQQIAVGKGPLESF